MSTENNTPAETPEVDLDDFAVELFSGSKPAPEPAKSENQEDEDDEVSSASEDEGTRSEAEDGVEDTTEEADPETDDDLANEDEDPEDEDDNDPAPKKTRFQKRIDELTAKAREEERQREADRESYEARIAALEKQLGKTDETNDDAEKPSALVEPDPKAMNEDGSFKYPLGEYDPQYMKDMAKFTFDSEFAAREAKANESKQKSREEAEKAALNENWTEKLGPARERYPDFQQKGEQLLNTFEGIDQAYGEYLSTALMALDNGPDVLYYLASNPEEADSIVKSGPMRATAALGRIDSAFAGENKPKATPKRKVSNAPTPPPRAKGTAVAKDKNDPYSDDVDLDALSRELAKRSY